MKKLFYLVAAFVAAFFFQGQVRAQVMPDVVGPFEPYPPRFNPYLPDPRTGAPSLASQATATGVRSTASTVAEVTRGGVKIQVPVKATIDVGKGAIARAAAATVAPCLTPIGAPVCAVATAAAVGAALKALGVGYGECGDGSYAFICKAEPNVPSGKYKLGTQPGFYASGQEACNAFNPATIYKASGWNGAGCYTTSDGFSARVTFQWVCPDGVIVNSSTDSCTGTPPPPQPVSEQQVETDLQTRMDQEYEERMRLHDALLKDEAAAAARGDAWPELNRSVKADTPVSVDAPPVSTPEKVTKTTTKTNPDGSVDTTTEKKKTTVTPKPSGSTVGDTKVELPSQTITTTVTVNNITNNTTTTTTTENDDGGSGGDEADKCADGSDLAACSRLGDPGQTPDIPTKEIAATFSPVNFASSASCPPPVTFNLARLGGTKAISWEPMCDVMMQMRPIFLAIAAAGCAWIFAMGVAKL